jgi:voltage-gated potassium channel Kch
MSPVSHTLKMIQSLPTLWKRLVNPRPIYLTITLFLFLLFSPTFSSRGGRFIMNAGFSLVLISALWGLTRRRSLLVVSLAIGAPWLAIFWIDASASLPLWLDMLGGVSMILFFAILLVEMLGQIITTDRVSGDTLARAVSAYLVLGIIWMGLYVLVYHFDSAAFDFSYHSEHMEHGIWRQFLYFSYSTMTTLGYGDITPRSGTSQALAMVQSIVGPMYLTILVARLVGLYDRKQIGEVVREEVQSLSEDADE